MDLNTVSTKDRVAGILLGLAAGDLYGGPVRMGVRLAESLADREEFDPDDILSRYLAWFSEDGFDTGPVAERYSPGWRREKRWIPP
jgi:hypothetical protein